MDLSEADSSGSRGQGSLAKLEISREPQAAGPDAVSVARWNEGFERRRHSREACIPGGERLAEGIGAKLLHRARSPENAEGRVERQKRLEQVLLIPEAQVGLYEFLRVVEGRKNVMEMHEDPGREFGQYAQADVDHVALDGDHVAGVDEKYVVGAKGAEELERRLLHGACDKLGQAGHAIQKEWRRVRLDGDEIAWGAFGGVFSHCGGEQQGGVAAADFNDAPGLAAADERIGHFSIDTLEKAVAEMKLVPVAVFALREVPLLCEGENVPLQSVYLFGDAEIQASAWLTRIPVFSVKGLETGYWEIEMGGCDVYAEFVLNRLKESRYSRSDPRALSETAHVENLKFRPPSGRGSRSQHIVSSSFPSELFPQLDASAFWGWLAGGKFLKKH